MYLLLAFAYQWIPLHIHPMIHFGAINNISLSAKLSSFTLVFLKTACNTNAVSVRKQA